jgi:hypothetical protein
MKRDLKRQDEAATSRRCAERPWAVHGAGFPSNPESGIGIALDGLAAIGKRPDYGDKP